MNLFKIFDATRKQREQIKAWAAKAGMDGEAIISKVESAFETDAEQFAAARWIIKGYDTSTFKQALYICGQKKIDPMGVDPEELVRKNPDVKPKEKAIDPDTVLTDKKDEGDGVVTYAAREKDREVLRQIINTHYGKDASPWCLLAGDGNGNLTYESEGYWEDYDAYPKRVAFRNGKLLAFSAGSNPDVREWWDRMDRSFPFIPYDGKTWTGKNGNTYSIKNGDVFEEGTRGDKSYHGRLRRTYSTDIEMTDRDVFVKGDTLCDGDGAISYDIVREDDKYYYVQSNTRYGMTKGQYAKDTLTQEGVFEHYRSDGSPSVKQTYKNDELDGLAEEYYRNGQLRERGGFRKGKRDGALETYYEDGQLKRRAHYKDGKYDGASEDYHENGQLHSKCNYRHGNLVGLYEEYYEDGKLAERSTYDENGELDGKSEVYYENGQLNKKCTFANGTQVGQSEGYYKNGQLRERCKYNDSGNREGQYESYHENGKLSMKCAYKDGEKEGLYERYYTNGQLEEKCTYKTDAKEGLYECYYRNGQLGIKCNFKDDDFDGPYVEYHENGQLREKCTYKNGRLVVYELYDTKGELVRRDEY